MFGNASFNHRLKFNYKSHKRNKNKLKIECYDRDFLATNDFIGETEIDLDLPIQDTIIKNKMTQIT